MAQAHLSPPNAPRPGASELDPTHVFGGVVDELVNTAVEEFVSVHLSLPRKMSVSPGQERLGIFQDQTSDGLICGFGRGNTVPVEVPADAGPRIWPCPFFVKDRKLYRTCWTRCCLLSLSDVREHLCTVHLEPIHCPVCYGTFQEVSLRDEHMRSQECHFELPPGFDGLRDSQVRDLEKLGVAEDKGPGIQERQWVKMWCIVFSCTRRPQSPFYLSQQDLTVYEFRRFWEMSGRHIVANVLEKRGLQQYEIENEERSLQALFSRVADHAVDLLLPTEDT